MRFPLPDGRGSDTQLRYLRINSPAARGSPVAVVPAVVELGDHEHGKTVTGRLTVANSGTADLMLEKFATTCSCAAVDVENRCPGRRGTYWLSD